LTQRSLHYLTGQRHNPYLRLPVDINCHLSLFPDGGSDMDRPAERLLFTQKAHAIAKLIGTQLKSSNQFGQAKA
jgi:hypothetical protein